MAVGIKFSSKCILFPDSKGYWVRLVFQGNAIVQGSIMLFDPEHDLVLLMENGADSKPEVVRKGDEMSVATGLLVSYTKVEGVTFKKSPLGPENSPNGHKPKPLAIDPGDASDISVTGG